MTGEEPDTNSTLSKSDPAGLSHAGYAGDAFDADEYRDALIEFPLNREQEDALLQALWEIMRSFVDIGWGVDTVQLVLPELFDEKALDEARVIEHDDKVQTRHSGGDDD